jgi:predicted ATPase
MIPKGKSTLIERIAEAERAEADKAKKAKAGDTTKPTDDASEAKMVEAAPENKKAPAAKGKSK